MSNTIVDDALSCLRSEISNLGTIIVERVYLGWGYAAARLDTGDVGLCHSLLGEAPTACCQALRYAGMLAGTKAVELAELAKSWHIGERVIGMTTINALSQITLKHDHPGYTVREGNVADELYVKPTDTVGMIGNIKPLVAAIREKTPNLRIFERSGSVEEGILPDTACEELLPEADIVLITGSAVANGTIEHLLQLSRNARQVAVVGPSASIVPDALFSRGVNVIGGVIVTDPDKAVQIVVEGGGTPQLKSATKFVVIKPVPARDDQRSRPST